MSTAGLFIRESLSDTPGGTPPSTWTSSPDVIVAGPVPSVSPSQYSLTANYGTAYGARLMPGQVNYVYLRTLNASSAAVTSRIWLFYVNNMMAPFVDGWRSDGIYVDGCEQNYCTVTASAAGQIAVSSAFSVNIPPLESGQPWDLIALVENPPLSNPPSAPTPYDQSGWDGLNKWANKAYGTVGWLNTQSTTGWGQTWQMTMPFTLTAGYSGQLFLGGICHKLPSDGYLALTAPGPEGCNYSLPKTPIAGDNAVYGSMLTVPGGFSGSELTITYWQGTTTPPQGANIEKLIMIPV